IAVPGQFAQRLCTEDKSDGWVRISKTDEALRAQFIQGKFRLSVEGKHPERTRIEFDANQFREPERRQRFIPSANRRGPDRNPRESHRETTHFRAKLFVYLYQHDAKAQKTYVLL